MHMNAKAEKFKQYLEERKIDAFDVEEYEDELKSVVFRAKIEVEGEALPTLVILDNSLYGLVRVRVAANAKREGNETVLLQKINDINKRFKVFKYYVADDGSLLLDCVLVNSGDKVDCEAIYQVIDVVIRHVADDYNDLMKAIWA